MNKSRIRKLEKRIMPEPEEGPTLLRLYLHDGMYFHEDDLTRGFATKHEAVEACLAKYGGGNPYRTLIVEILRHGPWGKPGYERQRKPSQGKE